MHNTKFYVSTNSQCANAINKDRFVSPCEMQCRLCACPSITTMPGVTAQIFSLLTQDCKMQNQYWPKRVCLRDDNAVIHKLFGPGSFSSAKFVIFPTIARSSPPGVSRSPSSSSWAGCTSGGAPCPPPCHQPGLQASSQERSSPGCPRTCTRWGRSCLGRCTATRGQLSAPRPAKPNLVHGHCQFSSHGYMIGAIGFVSRQTCSFREEEIWAITRSLDCEDRTAEDLCHWLEDAFVGGCPTSCYNPLGRVRHAKPLGMASHRQHLTLNDGTNLRAGKAMFMTSMAICLPKYHINRWIFLFANLGRWVKFFHFTVQQSVWCHVIEVFGSVPMEPHCMKKQSVSEF